MKEKNDWTNIEKVCRPIYYSDNIQVDPFHSGTKNGFLAQRINRPSSHFTHGYQVHFPALVIDGIRQVKTELTNDDILVQNTTVENGLE